MKYTDIINEELRSEFLNDLFETYDVEVIYFYDRCNEGLEDEYRAEIPDMGLEFLFDKKQKLKALFMTKKSHTGYNPFEGEDPRNSVLNTASRAISYAKENAIDYIYQEAKESSLVGHIPEFVKFKFITHSVHYSYEDGVIKKVSIHTNS